MYRTEVPPASRSPQIFWMYFLGSAWSLLRASASIASRVPKRVASLGQAATQAGFSNFPDFMFS